MVSSQHKNTFTAKNAMGVIVILLIASITVAGLFLAGFLWCVKNGQYEDEYSPPVRILFDDKPDEKST